MTTTDTTTHSHTHATTNTDIAPVVHAPGSAPPWTWRSVIGGLIASVVLCAMNSYLTLSFGVIEEGPTIAALFFFAALVLVRTTITTTEMVIVATMGSAGGSLGFIANFFAAKAMNGTPYTVVDMTLFGIASSLVGLAMVVPLRQLLVLREQLPWPGSKAVEGVIRTLVEHGDPRQAVILLVSFLGMVVFVIGNNEDGFGWWGAELALPFGLAAAGGVIALAPFAIGGSYLMGMRTCVGFLIGAVLLMVAKPWMPIAAGASPHTYYWPGLGFLVGSGMMSLALGWRTVVGAFRSMIAIGGKGGGTDGSGNDDDDPIMSGRAFLVFAAVAFAVCAAVLSLRFAINFGLVVVLVLVGGLVQNIIATRAAAQAAFNPARVMGILLQGVTSSLGGSAASVNLTGAGFVAGSGAQAGNLTGDLVYGRAFGVPSRWQFWFQSITIVPCALVSAWMFDWIQSTKNIATDMPAPVAKMWAASARVFDQGFDALPAGAGLALLVGAIIGAIYATLENQPKLEAIVPGGIGIGLGLVLSPSLGLAFFVGGFVFWVVLDRWLKIAPATLTTIAIAAIVAEGIGGVAKPLLVIAGVLGH